MRYDPRMASPTSALALLRNLRCARVVLLALALVIALAQAVAIGHGYSHGPAEGAAQSAGKHLGGLAHCHVCIAAAAVGGAPPPGLAPIVFTATQQQPPAFAHNSQLFTPHQRPYAIRAPPTIAI